MKIDFKAHTESFAHFTHSGCKNRPNALSVQILAPDAYILQVQ